MKKSWKKTGTITSIDLNFEECLFIRHMFEEVQVKGKDAFFFVELATKIVNAFENLEKEQLDLQKETQVN